MRIILLAALAAASLAATSLPGRLRAEEPDGGPLVFTVHPSGVATDGETLDEKLARRAKGFRFICVGCARREGRVAEEPFRPLQTLNAPGLAAALAVEP